MFTSAFMFVLGGSFPIMLPLCNPVIPPLASSDLLCRFFWITILSSVFGSAYISLYWKRDNSYIELMTCCQQRAFLTKNCSETAELNLTKLDRKQDLNILYQVCVFRADPKTKMWQQMWHIVLGCTICGPLGPLSLDTRSDCACASLAQSRCLRAPEGSKV